jgi:hypothetical protein
MENSFSQAGSSSQGRDTGLASDKTFSMKDAIFSIPQEYGDNKAVLMVRDPWAFFAYWEIKKEVEDRAREEIKNRGLTVSKSLLRVYDVTGIDHNSCSNVAFDFELKDFANSWYVHGKPEREWVADIGILCANGEFFRLARTNVVRTPSNRISDIIDEEWMCPEDLYHKMFQISKGVGKSSLGIKELIERYLRKWLFSGGVSSGQFGSASFFMGRKK